MIRDADISIELRNWEMERFFSLLAPADIEFVSLDIEKASLIIESILARVPLPCIYGYELLNEFNKDSTSMFHLYTGHKIVSAVKLFMDNKFALKGMQIIPYVELEGLRCDDLNIRYQNRIREHTFELYLNRWSNDEMIPAMAGRIKAMQSLLS